MVDIMTAGGFTSQKKKKDKTPVEKASIIEKIANMIFERSKEIKKNPKEVEEYKELAIKNATPMPTEIKISPVAKKEANRLAKLLDTKDPKSLERWV